MANLNKIRELCSANNITLRELAKRVGISEVGLQRIINTNSTKVETIERIARVLNVSVNTFFTEDSLQFVHYPYNFVSSYYSKMLVNRYDKISDKIAILKDLYVSEVFYLTSKRIDLVYPVKYPGSPKYIFDKSNPDELNFYIALSENKIDRFIYEPYSQVSEADSFLFKSFHYFFEAFYFILFLKNTLNIKDFLNEGLKLDDELMKYWMKYKSLDEKYHFK